MELNRKWLLIGGALLVIMLFALGIFLYVWQNESQVARSASLDKNVATNGTFIDIPLPLDQNSQQFRSIIPNGTDIQDYILPFRRECTTRVCLAEKKLDYIMAIPSCDGIVNGTGYPYYTWPLGYLYAKTMILININDTKGAMDFYLKYRDVAETNPGAQSFYKKYLDCMNRGVESFNMTCLRDGLCKP